MHNKRVNLIDEVKLIIMLYISCACTIVYADYSALQPLYLTEIDGLSDTAVGSIVEDHLGFVWFGTRNGLNRYDGNEFKVFRHNPNNLNSLSDNYILSIYEDKRNHLWVGTKFNGINQYNPLTATFKHYKFDSDNTQSISSNLIYSIVGDDLGNIWLGTSKGLNKLNPVSGKVTRYLHTGTNVNEIPHNAVYSLSFESPNILWIGTHGGLSQLNVSTDVIISFTNEVGVPIIKLYTDPKSITWVATQNGLLKIRGNLKNQPDSIKTVVSKNKYTTNKINFTNISHKLKLDSNYIRSINRDLANNIWIGTNKEIACIDQDDYSIKARVSTIDENSKTNSVNAITATASGQLFAGTRFNGLIKINLNNTQFIRFSKNNHFQNKIKNNSIVNFEIYEDTVISLDNSNTIENISDQSFVYADVIDQIINNDNNIIVTYLIYKHGIYWAGTLNHGLISYNTKVNTRHVYKDKLLPQQSIKYLFVDPNDLLWVATNTELSYLNLDDNIAIQLSEENKYEQQRIYSIDVDDKEDYWFASSKGLLKYSFSDRMFESIDVNLGESFNNIQVYQIEEDDLHNLWLATNFGLIKYSKQGVTKHYSKDHGLSNNLVYAISIDKFGYIWLATNYGLNKFNSVTEEFKVFYAEDGLQGSDFDRVIPVQDRDGRIYFAGPGGVSVIEPDKPQQNQFKPKIVFTDFKIANKLVDLQSLDKESPLKNPIEYAEYIILDHKKNDFEIEFAALDFHNPKRNQYAYKLIGYDKDWKYTDYRKRIAHYTNLDVGDYLMHVKASNHHGIWNEEGRYLNISVLPAPWQTWWANSIYAVIAVVIVWMMYFFRTRQLRQRAMFLEKTVADRTLEIQGQKEIIENLMQKKDQIFANISHEIRTPLTLILGPIKSVIKKAHDNAEKEQLSIVQRNTYRLLRMVDQLLDLSRLQQMSRKEHKKRTEEYTSVHDLLPAVVNSFSYVCKEKNIQLNLLELTNAYALCSQSDLEKIILNLVTNAIKYSLPESIIEVSCTWSDQKAIKIKVKDTGIGIPADKLDQVFERFVRVHDEGSIQESGAGIGLAVVKEIVKTLGGSIYVESELGKGSTFNVTLDAVREEDMHHLCRSTYKPNIENSMFEIVNMTDEITRNQNLNYEDHVSNKTTSVQTMSSIDREMSLLLIEDNPDMRKYICSLLKDSYRVITAVNGEEGVKVAKENIPDLIVSDIMMPKLDGYHVCQILKADELTCHIPVILLTALDDRDNRLKGLRDKADDYITKPFDTEELILRIENLVFSRNLLKQRFNHTIDKSVLENLNIDLDCINNEIDNKFIKKLKKLLEENYSNLNLDLRKMARMSHMSERQLQRKTKAVIGQSPIEYLRSFRIKKSIEYIKKGYTIGTVAESCGFNTENYFIISFKSHMGITPKQFQMRICSAPNKNLEFQ